MKELILICVTIMFLSSCNTEKAVESVDLNGKWLCYADFYPADSINNPMLLSFNESGKYKVALIDANQCEKTISSGDFSVSNNQLELSLSQFYDSNFVFPEVKFNRQQLKLVQYNNNQGLQIKVNNLWYFFEKVN